MSRNNKSPKKQAELQADDSAEDCKPVLESIAGLPNLGPASREMLDSIGIKTGQDLLDCDAIFAYHRLKQQGRAVSLNLIYAILGAQQGKAWRQIQKEQKAAILAKLRELD